MNRIAFFWIGKNITIPQTYVDSIRLVHGKDIEVIQLSDMTTLGVAGVNEVMRRELSEHIMIARLQAYCQLEMSDNFTLFSDADCLIVNPIEIQSNNDILLSPRALDFPINPNFPEYYPEFVGKMIGDVMPFLFGAIAVRKNNSLFKLLLSICEDLPPRFHRWYGDQIALAVAAKDGLFDFDLLNPEIHLKIINQIPSERDLILMRNAGTQLITFKGPKADKEKYLPATYDGLKRILEK